MGDTVTAPGTGAVLGFDTVALPDGTANVLVARTKVGFGVDGSYADVTAAAPLPVTSSSASATLVDKSGTITTGGTAQTLAAINASRRGFMVQNNSAGDMRINPKGAASSTAGILLPGGRSALYEFPANGVPTTLISIWGATTGQAFEATEW